MFLPLLALPLDLLHMIIDFLPIDQTLFALSCTCCALHTLLAPVLVPRVNTVLRWAAENNQATLFEWAIAQGAAIPSGRDGAAMLYKAIDRGYAGIMRVLLERGAAHIPSGRDGELLLGKAVDRGYVGVVRVLLGHGADPNKGFWGAPPLANAACGGDVAIVRMLLEAGADVSALQRYSADLARRRKYWAMASLLDALEHGHYKYLPRSKMYSKRG